MSIPPGAITRLVNPPTTSYTLPSALKLSSFLPTQIPGCQLWLDAADPAGTGVIPANGSTLTTWKDKSPTGNNMTVSSGTVTYTTNPYSVSFPNAQVTCTSALSTNVLTAGSSCIFIVVQDTYINATTFGMAFACVNIAGGDYSIRFQDTTTGLRVSATNDIGSNYYVNGTLGSPVASIITVPSGYNVIDGTFTRSGTTQFSLSSTGSWASRYFTGNIQEVIVYSGPITTSQQQQVEGYLAWKWGLQGKLGPSNPYVTQRPNPSLTNVPYVSTILGRSLTANFTQVSFSPKSVTGLWAWLDAADTSTLITSDGTNLTQWNDKSGANNNFSVLNANTFKKSSDSAAGYSSIVNLPNGTFAQMRSASYVTVTTNFVFFCVAKYTGTNSFMGYLTGYGDYALRVWSSAEWILDPPGGSVVIGATDTAYVNGVSPPAGLYYNGGIPAYVAPGMNTYKILNTPFGPKNQNTQIYIAGTSTGRSYDGNFLEFLYYTTPPTTRQRQQIEGYLAWKWNLQGNLPATHPYKLFPPPP